MIIERDFLSSLCKGRCISVSWETLYDLIDKKYIAYPKPVMTLPVSATDTVCPEMLTSLGREIGEAHIANAKKRAKKASASRKAREDAIYSLGMKRNRDGGYE